MAAGRRQRVQAEKKKSEKLDVYLMDKIAQKGFLNYHSASTYHQQAKRFNRGRHNAEDGALNANVATENARPRGVPSRLRLLTVDVPEFKRDAFEQSVTCKLPSEIFGPRAALDFADGVAPAKPMNNSPGHTQRTGTRSSRKPIVQKSLAKQLYYCYDTRTSRHRSNKQSSATPPDEQRSSQSSDEKDHNNVDQRPIIGVEILETSVMEMNPNNIRRMYTSTSKRMKTTYEMGKRTMEASSTDDQSQGVADADEAEIEEASLEQSEMEENAAISFVNDPEEKEEEDIIGDPDYERAAPWNQYGEPQPEAHQFVSTYAFDTPLPSVSFNSTQPG